MNLNRETLSASIDKLRDRYLLKITHDPTGITVEGVSGDDERFTNPNDLEDHLLQVLTDKVIEFKVKEWHDAETEQTVYEYLGVTWDQYAAWAEQREERLSFDTIGTGVHEDAT